MTVALTAPRIPAFFFQGYSCLLLIYKNQVSDLTYLEFLGLQLRKMNTLPCYKTLKRGKLTKQVSKQLFTIPLFEVNCFTVIAVSKQPPDLSLLVNNFQKMI